MGSPALLLRGMPATATGSTLSLRHWHPSTRKPVSKDGSRQSPCRVSSARTHASYAPLTARLVCGLLLTCVGLMGCVSVGLGTEQWRCCPFEPREIPQPPTKG
jgi:hypothetical protein